MHYLFHTTVRLPAPPPQAAADFVLECDNLLAREKQFHKQMELQLLREKEESAALERSRQQVVARCEDMPCGGTACHQSVKKGSYVCTFGSGCALQHCNAAVRMLPGLHCKR